MSLRHMLKRMRAARDGSISTTFAFSLVALVGVIGLSVDTTRAILAKDRLQRSVDAAGLAAGSNLDPDQFTDEATQYFNANMSTISELAMVDAFDVSTDAENEFITVTASARLPTSFMKLFGINDITVDAETVIRRQTKGMELALVMDNTGSMRSGGKMDAAKDAAVILMDILFGDEETQPDLWVSLVPYTAAVNVDPVHIGWLDGADGAHQSPGPFDPTVWKGCVMARVAPADQTDDTPTTAPFSSYLYPEADDNQWPPIDETNGAQNEGHGPNLGCGPAITPLTESKTELLNGINEMLPWHRGGTTGNLGLVWGWRSISPKWRGLWNGVPADMPLDYTEPLMEKVIVIMTDGQNQFFDWKGHDDNNGVGPGGSDFTAHGRLHDFGFTNIGAARAEVDLRFAAICQDIKDEDVLIYAVTFGPSPDTATQDLYRTCASNPDFYFHSPDNESLSEAFQTIGQQLSNLRISQ